MGIPVDNQDLFFTHKKVISQHGSLTDELKG